MRVAAVVAVTAALGLWAAHYAGDGDRVVSPASGIVGAARSPVPAPAAPTAATSDRESSAPSADEPVALSDDDPSPTHRGLTVKQAREREARVREAREGEARNAELHARNTARWETEERDAAWADAREEDIRRIVVDAEVDGLLVSIRCRRTLCRLEVDIFGAHSDLQRLQGVPGLLEALGGDQLSTHLHVDAEHAQRTYVMLGPTVSR